MVSKSLVALAVAGFASAAQVGKVNAYSGQRGVVGASLHDLCDGKPDYITLSSAITPPENHESGWSATDFGPYCWATAYKNKKKPSRLLGRCDTIQDDLPYCKEKGVKILLSIDGAAETANYSVSTEENGREFAKFIWKVFGPYDASWKGPRPFDKNATQHSSIDGIDFEFKISKGLDGNHFNSKPWIAMVEQLRAMNDKVIITCVTQGPTADEWFSMNDSLCKTVCSGSEPPKSIQTLATPVVPQDLTSMVYETIVVHTITLCGLATADCSVSQEVTSTWPLPTTVYPTAQPSETFKLVVADQLGPDEPTTMATVPPTITTTNTPALVSPSNNKALVKTTTPALLVQTGASSSVVASLAALIAAQILLL